MATAVKCVDLSHYQKGFDFDAFSASGGLGVILKATEGATYQDDCYKTFRTQALAVELKVASYHFLRSGDMAGQAAAYLKFAEPVQGERVVVDWEDEGNSVDDVVAFLKAIRATRPDLQLTVYTGHVGEEALGSSRNPWLADNTALWTAQYGSSPGPWPTGTWPTWSLWQYSQTGRVPGYAGDVDLDSFNGTPAQFLKWMGPAGKKPKPPTPVVTVTLTSDQPITLKLGANVTISE